MQTILRLAVSGLLFSSLSPLHGQVQDIYPCETITFELPPESWGVPYLQFSGDGEIWEILAEIDGNSVSIIPELQGLYRVRVYDESCDSSYFSDVIEIQLLELPPGTVCNPATGRIWMDRNLGASQVATSPTDAAAYGGYYQWGRATTSFTPAPDYPYDWSVPQNDNLWQGVNGINNPCPAGFRIPTEAEWNEELLSWASTNTAGAFGSPLKLTAAGGRGYGDGALFVVGSLGYYWSSTVSGISARYLYFGSGSAYMDDYFRAFGFSVRCIKD